MFLWLLAFFTEWNRAEPNLSPCASYTRPFRVFGNRGTRTIFSGEQGNKGIKNKGNTGNFGDRDIENEDFIMGEQGNKAIFSRGTREQVLSLGGPLVTEIN